METETLEKKIEEADFIDAIKTSADELGFEDREWNFSKGKEHYRIKKVNQPKHEYGEGGQGTFSTVLCKVIEGGEEKVLEARYFASWTTSLDDSIDQPEKQEYSLIFYSEDKLAREVFEKLR